MVFDQPHNATFVTESDAERQVEKGKERRGFVSSSSSSVQASFVGVFQQQTFVIEGDQVKIRESFELEAV